ncbi:MAG: PAS domain S-box protein, partial [Calditrichaeota bacterium]|nr:PAS domain S-box protein [Calditrichota bacterium]
MSGKIVEIPETEFVSPYENKKVITIGRLFPIFDPTGALTNVVVMQEDVTERKRAEEAQRESERITHTLYESTQALAEKDDWKEIIAVIVERATDLFGGLFSKLYLWDQERELLVPHYCNNMEDYEMTMAYNIKLGVGFIGTAGLNRRGMIMNYNDKDKIAVIIPGSSTERDHLQSMIVEPLLDGDRLIGTIDVTAYERVFTEEDQALLRVFARQAAIAYLRSSNMKALRESEEKSRRILTSSPDAIVVTNLNGNIIECNDATLRIYGYSSKNILIGKKALGFIAKKDLRKALINIKKVLEHGLLKDIEYSMVNKDGIEFPVEVSASIIRDESNNPQTFVTIIRDITERKQAENLAIAQKELAVLFCETSNLDDALKLSIEKAIQVSGMDSGGIYVIDENTSDYNLKYSTGLSPDFLESGSHYSADSPNVQIINKGKPIHTLHTEMGVKLNDKRKSEQLAAISIIPMLFKGKPVGCMNIASHTKDSIPEYAQHALEVIAGQLSGIITRFNTESKLKKSEERYRRLFEDDMTGDYVSTPDGWLITCNPAFAAILGFKSVEEATSASIESFYVNPNDRIEFINKLREKGRLELFEKEFYHRDDRILNIIENAVGVFNDDGELIEIRGYIIDKTDQKKLEEQFRQAQKMESVGRLAGGIAHDFNNLLTVITGNSELAKMSIDKGDPLFEDIEEISKAAERAADLTHQLLAFSRKQTLQPKIINLNQVISNLDKMLRRIIGEDIDLQTVLSPTLRNVNADPGQITQIITNLAVNSRDAMPKGGKLTIETENVELDEEYVKTHPDTEPGLYVMIGVSDSGEGMSEEIRSRIFDPFYTTKETGKGTGLGLSTVYGIVKQSGGSIWVYSEPGKGTSFKIYLPAVKDKV